jgi:DNA mismatch repair ATPase MutS
LILNAFFPWDLLAAWQLGRQQAALTHSLPRWLAVWADLEALCSLATFAALHPGYPFPTLTAAEATSLPFQAHQLGHPLIPAAGKVRNEVRLEHWGQVWLITGSNMAGKSSFLRTVGVNLALAYAGSVVDADHLEASLMRLYTSMRITDSLEDGISYFYAEVQRLHALLEALQDSEGQPLCFLIDEIFRGTNNRERLLGSRAYIRALLGGRGVGAVATHDLDLTQLEGVENYHFREEVNEGRMVFDYRLRPGPCPTTNALTIMRLAGLPIPTE